ncbi:MULTISPECIES: LuxR family transcriptional regulator [Pseudomonas]|uniref:Response regulator containing a CheY-like receiver domain and an HTH DNA-binding domain n=1 Tax=Pseudomonas asplenii TaxID=53407 RepID=A0A0N0E1E4_9PSED|nr:LuxR family transcriptional regulator [Pseudomonas fuscovaginae]KPA87584.1 response regulator containing a CheY-like receiver domain and an HTH DNA-binding domain [Pseudomonas fuscovaginae]KPA94298.1 response regulator containing a CheY-like receiver domain and an HTH DNA-binding domain [Pseudomonas fuscovaginae]
MPKLRTIKHTFDLAREVENNMPGASEKTYVEVLSWALQKLEITRFAYVYADSHLIENGEISIHGNYPQEWVDTYRKQALYKSDPVMANAAITSSPFFWATIHDRARTPNKVFEQSARYGIDQGFSIPTHEPGSAFGSLHLPCVEGDPDFERIIHSNLFLIQAISTIIHQHRPIEENQEELLSLSPREIEFLHWLALGKNYQEIGLIMNITERTVKFYAKKITEKLGCTNIRQAMVKAIRYNIF